MPPASRHALAAALAGALLHACGGEEPGRVRPLRLWQDGPAELLPGPPPAPPRTVYAADFAAGVEGWEAVVHPGQEGPGPSVGTAVRDGRTVLELEGSHGGLHRVCAVEPDTCYLFEAEVRADGIEPALPKPDWGRVWLAEAERDLTFEELNGARDEAILSEWLSTSPARDAGWSPVRRLFVTGPRTHFLHLVCALTTRATLAAGRVQFARLRLEAHPRASLWSERLARESAQRAIIDPPTQGEQRRRRVSAELGGETRPSLVLLPGERLRFALPGLAPGLRLTLCAGLWSESSSTSSTTARTAPASGAARLEVRAGERSLVQDFAAPPRAEQARWRALELPLGSDVQALEFAATGELPLVLGAPRIDGPPALGRRPNLVVISIDTLRADHVGAAEGRASLTPSLDRLARAGLRCTDASAASPYTLPSHVTLLTGQFPSVHGVVAHESRLSAARSTSLAELLAREGYATRAFTAGGFVNPVFGLDQGFEAFSEIDPVRAAGSHFHRTLARKLGEEEAGRRIDELGFAGVERWLRARGGAPFFLFLHTYAVHDYDAPPAFLPCAALGCPKPRVALRTANAEAAAAFTPAMRAHVRHLYEAALRHTDERLGRLFALLEELGVDDSTLIVVTSDHGEEFFEHGLLQHGHTLYEELLRIPLLLRGPGVAPGECARPVMLVDVVPTVLARLGLAPPESVQGLDLLGPAWPARAVWAEVDSRFARKYALREEDGRKTIQGPETSGLQRANARAWELYELARDPGEQHDLAPGAPGQLRRARERLESHRAALEQLGRALGEAGAGELGAHTLQELEDLGYAGE